MKTKRSTKPNTKTQQTPTVVYDTPYMRIHEAASYLRVAPWAIGAAIREGSLPHIVIGKRYILLQGDLNAWAAKQRIAA